LGLRISASLGNGGLSHKGYKMHCLQGARVIKGTKYSVYTRKEIKHARKQDKTINMLGNLKREMKKHKVKWV